MSEKFENEVRNALRSSATQVDQRTRDELARRRRVALDAAAPGRFGRWLWLPAGVAAAALATVLVLQPQSGTRSLPVTVAEENADDMEILLAGESLELYEELEFYEWLDTASDAG